MSFSPTRHESKQVSNNCCKSILLHHILDNIGLKLIKSLNNSMESMRDRKWQGIYKNRVKKLYMKFPLFYLLNIRISKLGKFQMIQSIILDFPPLDSLIQKIKEREFQKKFCRSLPCLPIYPGKWLMEFFSNVILSLLP